MTAPAVPTDRPSDQPALRVQGLRKEYRGGTTAIARLDLEVAPGELLGLLGPNGAGKSTLVKTACGLVRPTAGSVEVFGQRAGTAKANRRIGYLAELFRFPDWLKPGEVLHLHQRLSGSTGGAAERAELLDRVGLGAAKVQGRAVGGFSKGMQQRLGIAQALVGEPDLVLLDEPTSALDPAGRADVRRLLVELRERGTAVVLNSHLLGEVELVCDRVAIVHHGTLRLERATRDVADATGVDVETDRGARHLPDVSREQVPDLVAKLVADGERVFRVTPTAETLEQVYLDVVAEAERAGGGATTPARAAGAGSDPDSSSGSGPAAGDPA